MKSKYYLFFLILATNVFSMDAPKAPEQIEIEAGTEFLKAAKVGDLDLMMALYGSNPGLNMNVTCKHKSSGEPQTALDIALRHNMVEAVQFLIPNGAYASLFPISDAKERFPDLEQKLDGNISYRFFQKAEWNQLHNMIDIMETNGSRIDVNFVDKNKTPLDYAIEHKNEAMASLLIDNGAKRCSKTQEEFNKAFPEFWQSYASGKYKKVVKKPIDLKEKLESLFNLSENMRRLNLPAAFINNFLIPKLSEEIDPSKTHDDQYILTTIMSLITNYKETILKKHESNIIYKMGLGVVFLQCERLGDIHASKRPAQEEVIKNWVFIIGCCLAYNESNYSLLFFAENNNTTKNIMVDYLIKKTNELMLLINKKA